VKDLSYACGRTGVRLSKDVALGPGGGGGFNPPKIRSFAKAEPNSPVAYPGFFSGGVNKFS
jgi:hypothetical protein